MSRSATGTARGCGGSKRTTRLRISNILLSWLFPARQCWDCYINVIMTCWISLSSHLRSHVYGLLNGPNMYISHLLYPYNCLLNSLYNQKKMYSAPSPKRKYWLCLCTVQAQDNQWIHSLFRAEQKLATYCKTLNFGIWVNLIILDPVILAFLLPTTLKRYCIHIFAARYFRELARLAKFAK